MQAYKAKGKIDAMGNLVVEEPIQIPPGNVEVIILLLADEVNNSSETPSESQAETPKKQVRYRTKAFRDLLENSPPVPPDFDPEQAKWEYLKEKHNL